MLKNLCSLALAAVALAAGAPAMAADSATGVNVAPSRSSAHGAVLDAVQAGKRIVAVGEAGRILLSDDQGGTYRPAAVPVDLTLTAVSFADEKQGWAVGHGGVILHTADGGEQWTVQRQDLAVDQPLFSVYFRDSRHGWAAGLWSLLLATADGGKTWSKVSLPAQEGAKRADLNLLHVFEGGTGRLFIAAEQGTVLVSDDDGASWRYVKTGTAASLWAGAAEQAGAGVVAGLRGKMLRTGDGGVTWQQVATPAPASVTHVVRKDRTYWAATISGAVLRSADDGQTWQVASQYDAPVTALVALDGERVLAFSKRGAQRVPKQ